MQPSPLLRIFLGLLVGTLSLQAASLRPLGVDTNQFRGGFAYSQSDDGTRVAGNMFGIAATGAILWDSGGTPRDLGTLGGPGQDHQARGVSGDGRRVAGFSSSPSGQEAFLWTEETGMIGLGSLQSFPFQSEANAISRDGKVVVGFSFSRGFEPFRWTIETGMVGLGDLPDGSSLGDAYAVNADGSVVVGYARSASGREAFRWTEATGMVGLGDLPGGGFDGIARGVNADGSVVVGTATGQHTSAFVWTQDSGMVSLIPPESEEGLPTSCEAYCVSADGTIVGGYGMGATLWFHGGPPRSVQRLLLEQGVDSEALGWSGLTLVRSVERRGPLISIVGDGFRGGPWWAGGVQTPFVAEFLDPTPGGPPIRIAVRVSGGQMNLRVEPGQPGTVRIERLSANAAWNTVHSTNVTTVATFDVPLGSAETTISLLRATRDP